MLALIFHPIKPFGPNVGLLRYLSRGLSTILGPAAGLTRFFSEHHRPGQANGAAFLQISSLRRFCGNWRCAQPLDGCQDTIEQISADGNFSKLEGNGTGVANFLREEADIGGAVTTTVSLGS